MIPDRFAFIEWRNSYNCYYYSTQHLEEYWRPEKKIEEERTREEVSSGLILRKATSLKAAIDRTILKATKVIHSYVLSFRFKFSYNKKVKTDRSYIAWYITYNN